MSIESVMPSNHLILCRPFLLLPSIFPSIRVFSLAIKDHISCSPMFGFFRVQLISFWVLPRLPLATSLYLTATWGLPLDRIQFWPVTCKNSLGSLDWGKQRMNRPQGIGAMNWFQITGKLSCHQKSPMLSWGKDLWAGVFLGKFGLKGHRLDWPRAEASTSLTCSVKES